MNPTVLRAFLATGLLAVACSSWGCVADRPSRNGVFNENQYVRKSFLVRPGDGSKADPGWQLKATITSTSTPNPLAPLNLFVGSENGGSLVRFDVTQDKLRMLNQRELGPADNKQATREAEAVNAWPITNVDLKYRVNLDGEKTNFYEENQELDWKIRQWVKINFAKNDLSDLAPYGEYARYILETCTDIGNSSVTLLPDSFKVDEKNDYMQWSVNLTLPLKFDNTACVQQYGEPGVLFQKHGRQSVNMTVMYSMVRAVAGDKITYEPLEIPEKDPIRRKYGTIDITPIARDAQTGLLGARELSMRFDPKKPLVWYFAPGYPEAYEDFFTAPNGIVDQTNKLFADANAATRMKVLRWNDKDTYKDGLLKGDAENNKPREFGDIRYNFIRWESDLDTGSPFLAVTQFVPDYRTGEVLSSSINVAEFALLDRVKARLDFYLESIGASSATDKNGEWTLGPAGCVDGDTIPLVKHSDDPSAASLESRNARSTLYAKMQEYLQKPVAKFGNLAPSNFVVPQDKDFYDAYFALLPYQVYRDPATNFFVTPEGGSGVYGPQAILESAKKEYDFHKLAAKLDQGWAPFDVLGAQGLQEAKNFGETLKGFTTNHRDYTYMKNFNHGLAQYDEPGMIQFIDAFQKNARHCVPTAGGGAAHWETKAEYTKSLTDSYYSLVVWHEFGHTLGLDHNFMASIDKPNFPHYKDGRGRDRVGMYQSSVMEYNAAPDRVFWKAAGNGPGWGPYDQGAISFIYGNGKPLGPACDTNCSFSGQTKSGDAKFKAPWADPHGFAADGKAETQYLFCNANHLKYTPFCRQFDFGTTPSEIIAAEIDAYEWQYKWRNFRLYRKFQDYSAYVDTPAALMMDMRRFLSQWTYDWSSGEIQDTLRRIGIQAPAGAPQAAYYAQLTDKFNRDISVANQLVASFHKAVIQQSSGERPFKTIYDNYFGDVTQQGIFLDKLLAMQSWVDIWQTTNFDPDQAEGAYAASYSSYFGDTAYEAISEDTVDSMVGGQYDVYTYFRPLAVSIFSQATHSVNYSGRIDTRDWIGGKVFTRELDFLQFFRGIAAQRNTYGCTILETCGYDPRGKRLNEADISHSDDFNEFTGPDSRRYAWAYVADRNMWIVVDRDRNTASYVIIRNYNNLVIRGEDDTERPFFTQLQLKYFLDSYNQYN